LETNEWLGYTNVKSLPLHTVTIIYYIIIHIFLCIW